MTKQLDKLFIKLINKIFEPVKNDKMDLEKELFEEFEACLILREFVDAKSYIETAKKQGFCTCKMWRMYYNTINDNEVIF